MNRRRPRNARAFALISRDSTPAIFPAAISPGGTAGAQADLPGDAGAGGGARKHLLCRGMVVLARFISDPYQGIADTNV
jgi:hypothetical protein